MWATTAAQGPRMRGYLRALFGIGVIGLFVLTAAIYVVTLYFAYLISLTSLWIALASILLPFLSQLYWIWHIWNMTGVFFNLLTLLCFGWLGLVAAMILLVSYVDG